VFSGGSYDDVARWLLNFVISHAKREHPRIEVVLDARRAREGRSYGVRLSLDGRLTPTVELDYSDVAANRGALAWCAALARRTREQARALLVADPSHVQAG